MRFRQIVCQLPADLVLGLVIKTRSFECPVTGEVAADALDQIARHQPGCGFLAEPIGCNLVAVF